jgi:hypothetical protein
MLSMAHDLPLLIIEQFQLGSLLPTGTITYDDKNA